MTVSASRRARDVPVWGMAPGLRRMARRKGAPARLAPKWPCLQLEDASPSGYSDKLAEFARGLAGVAEEPPPLEVPGRAFVLDSAHAKGQPESFIFAPIWLILRPEGSLHLTLRPEWAQKVVNKGWGTVHPFARYMAGAVPPQSLVVYAPRDSSELAIARRIVEAAHAYAMGRIGTIALPDSRW